MTQIIPTNPQEIKYQCNSHMLNSTNYLCSFKKNDDLDVKTIICLSFFRLMFIYPSLSYVKVQLCLMCLSVKYALFFDPLEMMSSMMDKHLLT
jgi:hypothetical protein